MKSIHFFLATLALAAGIEKLKERYQWTQLDWEFPSPNHKRMARTFKQFAPENALPVGVERWKNLLFVTVPRWRDGVPATLNYIDMDKTPFGMNPPLRPFPDWASNKAGDCAHGLSTVYRIQVDRCGRLWVLDTGTVGIGDDTKQVCPYALNIFDIESRTRLHRYEFKPEDTKPTTFIANIAVEVGRSCEDAHAYMSDELGYGLIVYSLEKNRSWRFEHGFFFPDPLRGDFNVAGLNFQWFDEGIFGMALSPMHEDGFRDLYFSPLASHREFMVSTKVLRNESVVESAYHEFKALPERGPDSHTTARVMSDGGVMLFSLIDQNAVGCWNSKFEYDEKHHAVAEKDDINLVFPSDVIIDQNNTVWVMSDKMPVFLTSVLDFTSINFQIFSAPLNDLIKGTLCEQR